MMHGQWHGMCPEWKKGITKRKRKKYRETKANGNRVGRGGCRMGDGSHLGELCGLLEHREWAGRW